MTVFKSYQDLEEVIRQVAKRKIEKYQLYHNAMHIEYKKNEARFIVPPAKKIYIPDEWHQSKMFNPFHVLKHSSYIAKSIYKKMVDNTYVPHEAFVRGIPKKLFELISGHERCCRCTSAKSLQFRFISA